MRRILDKQKTLWKDRKANLQDPFWAVAMLLGWAIFFIIMYYVWNQISPELSASLSNAVPEGETSYNVTEMGLKTKDTIGTYNNMFPLLLVGLLLFVIVSAFFIDSHPVFFFVSLILLMVLVTLGAVFSNLYQSIIETPEFAADAADFGIMNLFMEKLTWIILIIFVIAAIILFAKPGGGAGAGRI